MTAKKIPLRMCIGCREMKPKAELDRIVRKPDGEIVIDKTNKISGRGAYICKNVACLKKAQKTKRLSRVLECEIPDEVFAAMEEELNAAN